MPLYPDFVRAYPPETPDESAPTVWLTFQKRGLLVQAHTSNSANNSEDGTETLILPGRTADETASDTTWLRELSGTANALFLGRWNGVQYVACEIAEDTALPDGWQTSDLWRLHGRIDETEWFLAGYANHILHWRRTSGFCPVCGTASGPMEAEWKRTCAACGAVRYPPISPAVLVLVHDGGDRILLAHQPGWGDMHSILAGFVLPGESLEECARREVEEEVGVVVTDLVYAGSQPWPFPQQIMIGFFARYERGDIRLDEQELDGAEWYEADALPTIPPTLSLSRRMIDEWRDSRRK